PRSTRRASLARQGAGRRTTGTTSRRRQRSSAGIAARLPRRGETPFRIRQASRPEAASLATRLPRRGDTDMPLVLGLASSHAPSMFCPADQWPRVHQALVKEVPQPPQLADETPAVLEEYVQRIQQGFGTLREQL